MVAIVAGNGAGVSNSSANTLGQQGIFGDPTLGKTKEAAYVNVSNGNLVVQDKDDFVVARGLNLALTRTYNSQGTYSDVIGDDWKLGLVKQVTGLTGTANTSGSTVVRIDSDGSSSLFTYDDSQGCYVSSDGAGAYQRLKLDEQGKWIWTSDRQDETGNFEIYDSALNDGRIQSAGQNGETLLTYSYDTNNRLAFVNDASGDTTQFLYDSAGHISTIGRQPTGTPFAISTVYSYDDLGRMTGAMTKLSSSSPHRTTYQYDGNSDRIATIDQGDGTKLSFTYVLVGSDYKVKTVTDALGAVTTFDYSVAGRTTVTDPMGVATSYAYDAQGRLTAVIGPTVGGVATGAGFEYDDHGNVTSVTDGRGLKTVYQYDANGNRIYERDPAGDTITRVYDLKSNQLLSETHYATPDPDGDGTATAAAPATTQYVYDTSNRLRFVISATGIPSPASRWNDAMNRPGCTAGRDSPISSGPKRSTASCRSSTTSTNPQKRAPSGASSADSTTSAITGPRRWKPWRMEPTSRTRRSGSPVAPSIARHVRSSDEVRSTT